ncbi:hypothetical protein OPV22_008446 [Ensete ventricosum]|uniref:Uncharacterized protein n=1 Tax=Ensete ventricosum TaxID=4639 RepID=A0AAV8RER2_ENSVE|nr:hypothetical protein OPV22_008446 [Ensete ventricosum]
MSSSCFTHVLQGSFGPR